MSPDIISIGELLIDFIAIERNISLEKVNKFQKFPGGAPSNVIIATSSLGISSGLITKVGNDRFGDFLVNALKEKNVDTSQVFRDNQHHTGIVFVESRNGIPGFVLYTNVAYNYLKKDEISTDYIKKCKILNFGGVMLLENPSRDSILYSLKIAKAHKIPISFDINLRQDLLKENMALLDHINKALAFVDILKIGMSELFDLYLYLHPQKIEATYDQAIDYFLEHFNFKFIAITMGEAGSKILTIKNKKIKHEITEPVYKVDAIDSIGAGDAFLGALLSSLLKINKYNKMDEITESEVIRIIKFCNKFAALSTTKVGAWNLPKIKIPF